VVFTVENSNELSISSDGILEDSRCFFGDPVGVFPVENSDELLISLDGILEDSRSFFEDPVGVFTVENSNELLISFDESCPVDFFATGFLVAITDFIAVTALRSFVA